MNRRTILRALIPMGAVMALANRSQADPGAPRPGVALPEAGELPGFSVYYQGRPSEKGANVALRRDSDGLRTVVTVYLLKTPEIARDFPARYNARISVKGAGLKKVTRPGRVIGQELWSDRDRLTDPFSIVAIDGRSVVEILVEPRIGTGLTGFAVRLPGKKSDVTIAENLAADILERLTAMGLTSRPTGSASAKAKQQVKTRLQR